MVYPPHGVGKIVGQENKGSGGDCFAISFPSGMRAFVPVQSAAKVLRHTMTQQEAEAHLATLRGDNVTLPAMAPREKREHRTRVLRTGTCSEVIEILRGLYASKAPVSDADALTIRNFEDVVLEELALVLHVPRIDLENEMRERYPIFKKKAR